ncbi:hypothetical protein GCM10023147_37340 [Tsukamurella soli]|uniref:Uncharacterized protein n=1 Tax=Tsukamurella soli TaxID=644556 RepID=A0ABP8K2H8_9ACTN
MHLRGLRAMDWMAGKKDWREFYRFKDRLGPGTDYYAAMLDDPDTVEAMLKLPPAKPGAPALRDWNWLRETLTQMTEVIAASGGAKVKLPRPESEVERRRSERSRRVSRHNAAALTRNSTPSFTTKKAPRGRIR